MTPTDPMVGVPIADREAFIRDNAVVLVDRFERKENKRRREVTRLYNALTETKRHIRALVELRAKAEAKVMDLEDEVARLNRLVAEQDAEIAALKKGQKP